MIQVSYSSYQNLYYSFIKLPTRSLKSVANGPSQIDNGTYEERYRHLTHSDLFSAKGILNEVVNREVCIERKILNHECKTPFDDCFDVMGFVKENTDMFRGRRALPGSRLGRGRPWR